MARNGSGVYAPPAADYPAVASTLIESAKYNNVVDDIATALTGSIAADGQTTITANIPMNSKKFTGLANGSARTDSAALGQVQDGTLNWVDGGGTADAITATYSPVITTLVDGQVCFVRATAANATTTPTFAPNGLTARTIVMQGGVALVAGNISGDGHELILRYDLANTRWELLNPKPSKESVVGLTTTDSPQFAGVNLGHASDTTFTRVSAGVAAIEGVNILTTATGAALAGSASQAFATAALTASGVVTVTAGSAAAPAITTTGDTNCGIFFPAADSIAATVAGAEMWRTTANGFGVGMTPAGLAGTRIYVNNATGAAGLEFYPSNTRTANLYCSTSEFQIGTVTAIPINIVPNNATTFRFDASSNSTHITPLGLLGYGTGAGGTVTQTTSKSTAVTLNKPCGQITMDAAALNGGSSPTYVNFTLNNSLIAATDTVDVEHSSAGGTSAAYTIDALTVSAGAVIIRVGNISGGSLSQALVINFGVNKRATS